MESTTSDRKVTCPKCGTENLNWRFRCEKCGEELHKNERRVPKFENKGAGFWVAFILGLAGLVFLIGLSLFATGFTGKFPPYLLAVIAVPVLGLVLCWKWLKIAGIILITGGILWPVLIIIESGFTFGLFIFIPITLPLVTSGVMFFALGK